MTILGIDPGSHRMGWGIIRRQRNVLTWVASGVLKAPDKALPVRLGFLLLRLTEVYDEHAIDSVAVESAFVHINARTALVLGQSRGLPIALAASRGIAVHEYAPAAVKRQVVGAGRASKRQVQHMVAAQLRLAAPLAEDEADALAVAIAHAHSMQHPDTADSTPMTPAQRQYQAALQKAGKRRRR